MKIAVVGMGTVGWAVANGHKTCDLVVTIDKYWKERNSYQSQLLSTDLAFICVPTPTRANGDQDLTAVRECLSALALLGYAGVVVVKSTVLPGTMDEMKRSYPLLRLVHNPEFLSEKTAVEDYIGQGKALASGRKEDLAVLEKLLRETLPKFHSFYEDNRYHVTEYAKYLHNCMLAVKLSFLNEMFDLIGNKDVYLSAVDAAAEFGNIGRHFQVPGPDGKRGWGGKCFPKDSVALAVFAMAQTKRCGTLMGAIETNQVHRPEEMRGSD